VKDTISTVETKMNIWKKIGGCVLDPEPGAWSSGHGSLNEEGKHGTELWQVPKWSPSCCLNSKTVSLGERVLVVLLQPGCLIQSAPKLRGRTVPALSSRDGHLVRVERAQGSGRCRETGNQARKHMQAL
jgi:hypothetical protein